MHKLSVMKLEEILLEYSYDILGEYFTDVYSRNFLDNTPLHIAAIRGDIENAKILLMHGADIEAKGDLSCTPLYDTVAQGHYETAKFLLEQGADVHADNELDETIIECAERIKNKKLVELLKKYS